MMERRDFLTAWLAASATLATVLTPLPAASQDKYPSRPIHLVVPFPPGGVTDVVGRLWADKAKAELGTIVIDNRGGAGGTIGAAEVARAAPDGYTLLLGNTSNIVINPVTMPNPPYDPLKAFAPIAIITEIPTSIVIHPSVPAKNLRELIAYAKANPGKLSYGSAGAGTATNLSGELFKDLGGNLDIVHIPYKGAGPGMADLISGHIPMFTPNITAQVLSLHEAGKVRILAINAPKRIKAAPNIPTAEEAGVPGMVVLVFNGLFAPAGTPKAVLDRIAQVNKKVMNDPDMQKVLNKAGAEGVTDSSPAEATKFVSVEIKRWTPVLKATAPKK
ncbi:MAG: tripartite tricarboxylate transporter substrate binding protein [Rhizobiales bacterium]|nr:tripartite tricarboxylate transporter substrate binding protein [Hyphomicrobiales bacterium]